MTNDVMLGSLYLLIAGMMVLGALINRREPVARLIKMALAWAVIFGAGFVVFSFRDDLAYVGQRLKSEALGSPIAGNEGEVRVPMAIDGHFWVEGAINGRPVKFLVDSGATTTTVSRTVAAASGLEIRANRSRRVRTGNGIIDVATTRAPSLSAAGIERRDLSVDVTEEEINVLGMNYLSSLRGWGVEGRWLVLKE